jgi:phosphate/sulfate permease
MGIIAVLLYSQGYLGGTFHVPFWVVIACQIAMALGTLAGGWRIVRTMGSRITRLTPMQGFSLKPEVRSRSLPPPGWAFRCRRRTQSLVRS